MPFSILPDNIKAQKDSNSSPLLNHTHLTAQPLNTNKRLERKALKSSSVVPCLWPYNHKAAKNRNTNPRSLNRSLAKQRLGSSDLIRAKLVNMDLDITAVKFSQLFHNVTKLYSECQRMLE